MIATESEPSSECFGPDVVNYGMCPCGGFQALSIYCSQTSTIINGANLEPFPVSIFGTFANQEIRIASTTPKIPESLLWGSPRGIACQTSVVAPYVPIVMYQDQFRKDWQAIIGNTRWKANKIIDASKVEYRYFFEYSIKSSSQIPVVRTACSEGQNVYQDSSTINFPIMPHNSCWKDVKSTDIEALNSTPTASIRSTWVDLPADFGAISTGLVIETPWSEDGKSRVVIGCSVDARWAHGTVQGFKGDYLNWAPAESWRRVAELDTPFRPATSDPWPLISLDESWLRLLTPYRTDDTSRVSQTNHTTLETLLSPIIDTSFLEADDKVLEWNKAALGSPNRTLHIEWTTSLLVADGISRHRSDTALNFTGSKHNWHLRDYQKEDDFDNLLLKDSPVPHRPIGTDFTTFAISMTINGLCYKMQSVTDYLAMIVLLAHVLLVAAHIMYVMLWKRRSSSAWDSISEMLALAYKSRPSDQVLENTSGGITSFQTFGAVATIRAEPSPSGTDTEANTNDPLVSRVCLVIREGNLIQAEDATATASGDESVSPAKAPVGVMTWPGGPSSQRVTGDFELRPFSGESQQSLLPRRRRSRQRSQATSPAPSSREEWQERVLPNRLYS